MPSSAQGNGFCLVCLRGIAVGSPLVLGRSTNPVATGATELLALKIGEMSKKLECAALRLVATLLRSRWVAQAPMG
jgi:hypothetical protein